MNLAEQLHAASADPPPPRIDLDALMAREDRRRVRVRWLAAGCAAAVAITGTIAGVRLAAVPAPVDHRVEWSPDRLPDPATLPRIEQVWPDAVHRLPPTLPDGSMYTVHTVLGEGRYLVAATGPGDRVRGPSIFDPRAGTVTSLVPADAAASATDSQLLDTRVVGDQVVWMQQTDGGRELWAVRLDGTGGRRLATLPDGAGRFFTVAGDMVLWAQDVPGAREAGTEPLTAVWRVPLSGGDAAPLPGGTGWTLAGGPWLTTQVLVTGYEAHRSGELWNPATGEKLRWTTHEGAEFVSCGPAWCTGLTPSSGGTGPNAKVVLQRLDGSGYVELPYWDSLDLRYDGRLAVGSIAGNGPSTLLIWDRKTGRAGVVGRVSFQTRDDGNQVMIGGGGSPFWDTPVITWRTTDDLTVVDLTAIG